MQYVFLNNFRGFSDLLIPLPRVTFLVGENSTGKSSFLKLLLAASMPQFWYAPEQVFQDKADLGGYDDIVSASARDKSFFQVGFLTTKKEKANKVSCTFSVITFSNRRNVPVVSRYAECCDGLLTQYIFERTRAQYKITRAFDSFATENDALSLFHNTCVHNRGDIHGYEHLPVDLPKNLPLPVLRTVIETIREEKLAPFNKAWLATPGWPGSVTWISPIRTRPEPFYGGPEKTFSPEGDHIPYLLKQTLNPKENKDRAEAQKFRRDLFQYGISSGLFDKLSTHDFGAHPNSPFEILVQFGKMRVNIHNVGYGLSQVLPLVVQFLTERHMTTFAVQQPEVHLHPRAQAALGDLIFDLASNSDHNWVLETHSDFLIDRFRLRTSRSGNAPSCQVVFFQRTETGNSAHCLAIGHSGTYPIDQPREFRDFFIREQTDLLEI